MSVEFSPTVERCNAGQRNRRVIGPKPDLFRLGLRTVTFLRITLGQIHPALVAGLHAALKASGLGFNLPTPDSTLLAGPQRVHLTLGVMNLTPESLPTTLDLLPCLQTLLSHTDVPTTITLDVLIVLKR
ncbi:hypothetical protein ARMGADRAFT_1071276 [Armillaria gallica]|uniref:Uncharacterized protein n=1 Tax=Armillaria gallica TaxID=47427 RepID=A0A2H3E6J3_ARMGA|nr:hypothetical protein ARMGADRAFT_1071276 [Armillaria gallica]